MQFRIDPILRSDSAVVHELGTQQVALIPRIRSPAVPNFICDSPTCHNRFFYVSWSGSLEENVFHVRIAECRLNAGVTPVRVSALVLPPDTRLYSLAVSPTGDRVAWISVDSYVSPVAKLMERYLHIPARPRFLAHVSVANSDGTGIRELGRVAVSAEAGKNREISNVAWLPGEKHLSFVLRGALWVLPVRL
jgi:hypothetical protein